MGRAREITYAGKCVCIDSSPIVTTFSMIFPGAINNHIQAGLPMSVVDMILHDDIVPHFRTGRGL